MGICEGNSAEERPVLTTSSIDSHPRGASESTCKRSNENPMSTSKVLAISVRNSVGKLPQGKFCAAVLGKQAMAQSQVFTLAQ
jgi:hypothetical protein